MPFAQRLKTALDWTSTIAVITAAGYLIWVLASGRGGPGGRPQIEPVELSLDTAVTARSLGHGSVALVEFADYQCPFCGRHARDTFPAIRKNFIDTGDVRYSFMNFPLEQIHPAARQAGRAAGCAGSQDRFWEMHERLFTDPSALQHSDLLRHAEALGLHPVDFSNCLNDETDSTMQADIAEGHRLGVTSTPTFFLGTIRRDGKIELTTRINGVVSAAELTRRLTDLIARRQAVSR